MYNEVGETLLSSVLGPAYWGYVNAYAIYDYLYYQYMHNVTANALLSNPDAINPNRHINYLETLMWYANQQSWAFFGNLDATVNATGEEFTGDIKGSISTIAGSMLPPIPGF